ncbi:MAG TPA: S8 family serine peptidase [Solirubrobacterales bacterium]|nr:S8 family serine peptidase [Solirubrobacterales bacterium]
MKIRRQGAGFIKGAATVVMLLAVAGAGQPASAARVSGGEDLPRTFLLRLEPDSTVKVFREERSDGLAAARSAARSQKPVISRAQTEVVKDLPADADVVYRTHSVLASVGVRADAGDFKALEEIPGVVAVYPVAPKRADNSYAVPFQGTPSAWETTGFLGQGKSIAVIDTGVDYTHADFGGPGTTAAWEDAHANEAQIADSAYFPNAKVVGGIDLVGDSYNTDRSDPGYQPVPHPDPNPLDCGGHGTHVAGSAAGLGVNGDGSTYTGAYDTSTDFGAMKIGPGTAPEADVYAIRVLGCEGSTDVVTEAIDHAVDPNGDGDPSDHVDVINMSLGSDFGSDQDGDAVAANAAAAMGVAVIASAGNAGDHTDISGAPGNASRVLSVASTVDAQSRMDGVSLTIDGNPETFGMTRGQLYDWSSLPDLAGPVVAAPPTNETACSPYPSGTFTGKVVLVKWHDAVPECGSIARGQNLSDAGAIGFIFGSDSETFSAGINGSSEIPGVLVVASGADEIRDALDNSLDVEVTGTSNGSVIRTDPADNDKVSGFTSRGIHSAGNLKPDVAAVGSSVFSAAVGSGDGGVSNSGTSMAAPMVAGLAALVRQAHPGWNPLQVKAGIMNTAGNDVFVDGSANPSAGRYGPIRVGAGRIDASSAVANDMLAYNPDNGSVSVSFGPVEAAGPVVIEKKVTVENLSNFSETFDAQYDPITEVPGAEFTVSPQEVAVGSGRTGTVTVRLEIDDPSALTKSIDPTIGRIGAEFGYPRETLAEAMGRLLLTPDSPGATLRVPVYAAPRPASVMSQPDSLLIHRDAATAGQPVQSAVLPLTGSGVGGESGDNGVGDGDPDNDIFSIAAGFELQATSGEAPECGGMVVTGCYRLPEERSADLSEVGVTSDFPQSGDAAQSNGYFALAVHRPWGIPVSKLFLQVDIDVDEDGKPDLLLYNDRLGDDDTFISELYDPAKPSGQRVIDQQLLNGRFGDTDTALYDSDVMVLPVALAALADYGITPENPSVSYGVETYSAYSGQPIDLIGVDSATGDLKDPLKANLFRPGISVTDEDGGGPLVPDQPGEELTVTRNVESWQQDGGKGLMMVHFHNQDGARVQTVDLRGAATSTRVTVGSESIEARVVAQGEGLPVPGGEVVFSVDGEVVGRAQLNGGVARLSSTVPSGTPRLVTASYGGDIDFAPSFGQVGRSDPTIVARASSRKKRNARGWYRTPVIVTFTCTANGSPISRCPEPRRLTRDGRKHAVSGEAVAADGGRAAARVSGIKIDRTRPVVRIRGVRRGAVYSKIKRAKCIARDRTSGVRSCRIIRRRHGKRVVYTARATDRAGNGRTIRVRVRLRHR